MKYTSFDDIQKAIDEGTSVVEIVNYFLSRIDDHKDLNAFLEVFKESALAQAKQVDEKIKNGSAGRLAGMVIGLKDNLAYKNHKVSASSKILEGFESIYTATAVQRLLDKNYLAGGT